KIREWQEKYSESIDQDDPMVYGRDWIFDGTDKYGYRIYDPVEAMVKKNAFTQNHNLSMNGRTNATTYNASVGFLGQQGMMEPAEHDDFKRITGSLCVSTAVNDLITIRASILQSDRTKRDPISTNAARLAADPWLDLSR